MYLEFENSSTIENTMESLHDLWLLNDMWKLVWNMVWEKLTKDTPDSKLNNHEYFLERSWQTFDEEHKNYLLHHRKHMNPKARNFLEKKQKENESKK